MQKWEYVFVVPDYGKVGWLPRYVNGEELPDWKNGKSFYTYANELGKQGWELIATSYNSKQNLGNTISSHYLMTFKRPIE